MANYQPYTYLIGWSKLDYWYYGCQYASGRKKGHPIANPKNLWTTYFTSSKIIKEMRLWHGEPDVVEVRKVFQSREQALRCEEKVLAKVNAVKSDRWLNRGNAGKQFNTCNVMTREKIRMIWTPEKCEEMRLLKLGHKHSSETCEKIRLARISRPKGYKHTLETIEKMRLVRLGRKRGPYRSRKKVA